MEINFTVYGIPVGKGRPRFSRRGGHTYTPEKTKEFEEKVRDCWRTQSGKGFAGKVPLLASVVAYFPVPKSVSKKKAEAMAGTFHVNRPDSDNIAKAILDSGNAAGNALKSKALVDVGAGGNAVEHHAAAHTAKAKAAHAPASAEQAGHDQQADQAAPASAEAEAVIAAAVVLTKSISHCEIVVFCHFLFLLLLVMIYQHGAAVAGLTVTWGV